jgi:mono/diheme cytochrome c family protein
MSSPSRLWLLFTGMLALGAAACTEEVVAEPPADEATSYLEDAKFRRRVLEDDLVSRDNDYARERLELYATSDGWDALPEWDPKGRPLTRADVEALVAGDRLELAESDLESLVPETVPDDEAAWVALGERVFYDYPFRADPVYEVIAKIPGALDDVGFLESNGAMVGLRVFAGEDGRPHVGPTCAQCQASRRAGGDVSAVMANREMDIGAARLLAMGFVPGELPPEIDTTAVGDLDRLGPGRNDVLPDDEFNPYAMPDFGGLVDMPYLHHNANWYHRSAATLAVRCETLFITSSGQVTRIPRVLSYALARFLRSLPAPPPPDDAPTDEETIARGREVFDAAACSGCHVPPLFTSDRLVGVEEIGTDPAAGISPARATGYYRIPSLRGVGRAAPYLHHGALGSLEEMFDPERGEPGHRHGLDLSATDRAALLAFLRTL